MSKRTFVSLAFCLAGIFALYGQEENQNNYGVDEANTKFSLQSGDRKSTRLNSSHRT